MTMKSRSFLKQFVSLGVGTFIYLLVGLIGTPIITRLVDPVSYGDYSIFSVYGNLGLVICVLGLDQSMVRFFYTDESVGYRRRLLYTCMLPAIGFALGAGIAALFIVRFTSGIGFGNNPSIEVLLILVNVIALIFNRYSTLCARLKYDTNIYSVINIVQKGLFLVLSIGLVLTIKKNFSLILMISNIASLLIANMIGIIKERELWRPVRYKRDGPAISKRELFFYGIPLMFSSGITWLFSALDKLALDRFCTRADVGVYTSALNLLAVFSVVRTSFNAIWMPSAVEHYENDKEDKSYFQKWNSFISILMLLFGAGMIMCSDLFVLLLGKEYRDAALIFPFLMFEPIMYTISETTVTGLVVTKKSGYQVIAAAVACATNFIGNWVLTPLMGPRGAAISTGFSYIVFFAMRTILSNRIYYVDYHLPKLAVMTILLVIFALYGSCQAALAYKVIFFVVYTIVLYFVYRKECKEAFLYAKALYRNMLSDRKKVLR